MSHFTVLVIGTDPEKQLAPFQENNMGDCPKEYMTFHDVEEECRKDYEEDTVSRVRLQDGALVSPYDDRFKKLNVMGFGTNTHEVPADLEEIEIPIKQEYPDFEKYMTDYHGYKKDKETGRYGYWENPNAKWDWYLLGGRWTGMFKLKPLAVGVTGKPGIMTNTAKEGYSDQSLKGEIDFEYMRIVAGNKATERWELFHHRVDTSLPYETWESVRERIQDMEQAREFYHQQPRVVSLNIALKDKAFRDKFGWDVSCSDYGMPKEQYVMATRNSACVTFAVIMDGKWYERGSMGWWGCVSNEKEPGIWEKQFQDLIDSVPDDTLLSVYDCHI